MGNSHSLRVINLDYKYKKIITHDDLINAFQKFIQNRNMKILNIIIYIFK
jgi:hypothetical protein